MAVGLAFLSVRSAAVEAFAVHRPDSAARVAPGHPQVMTQLALAEIGRSVAKGSVPEQAILDKARLVLAKAPLAPEPFLIEGTKALSVGETRRGEALLGEVIARDPRQPAARLLLADMYLREGRTRDGLRQIGALIRRLPAAASPILPALTQFAMQPGASDELREIFRREPQLRDHVLQELANDSKNAALVVSLAGPRGASAEPSEWQRRLIQSLVKDGRFDEAQRNWARFSGVALAPGTTLFNAEFRELPAPPPFNWALSSGAGGVAESAPGGGVHLLHYGREDSELAAQIVRLPPGRYRLQGRIEGGSNPEGLSWGIQCLPANRLIAAQPIPRGVLEFVVPASGCPAQEVQFRGSLADVPTTAEATVRSLSLTRA